MSDETPTVELDEPVTQQIPEPVQEAPQTPKPTSATEWKRKSRARYLLTLPSGSVIKVRKPDWGRLLATGAVDFQELAVFAGSDGPIGPADVLPHLAKMIPTAQVVAREIALEPRIGFDTDDAITFSDIDDTDLLSLYSWARGVVNAVTAVEVAE